MKKWLKRIFLGLGALVALLIVIGLSSQAILSKIDASGNTLDYSSYLGGSGQDVVNSVASDASGNLYYCGYTSSNNFPTQAPFQSSCIPCAGGNPCLDLNRVRRSGQGCWFDAGAS